MYTSAEKKNVLWWRHGKVIIFCGKIENIPYLILIE